jgi:hypothetical protein
MSAREVIAGALRQWGLRDSSSRMAQHALDQIRSSGYAILSPDEVRGIELALSRAEEGAGTPPAREAVKLRPSDWHALAAAIRSLKGGRDAN